MLRPGYNAINQERLETDFMNAALCSHVHAWFSLLGNVMCVDNRLISGRWKRKNSTSSLM